MQLCFWELLFILAFVGGIYVRAVPVILWRME